ncbi:MAG: hypothetical protein J5762_02010 [Clostridia bacterium]|nr:hypothetical protein [Clostridia bacterium]
MKKSCVRVEGINGNKNVNVLFVDKIVSLNNADTVFKIIAADVYKFFINGKSVFTGPSRTAKGYCVENEFSYPLKQGENTIAVLVSSYGVASYYVIKKEPFFAISFSVDKKEYTENDFSAYELKERIRNVQRFSFQRGFAEIYKQDESFERLIEDYYEKGAKLRLKKTTSPEVIEEIVPISVLERSVTGKRISQGEFYPDENKNVWEDRSVTKVGDDFEGYTHKELYECLTDKVCKFSYNKTAPFENFCGGKYAVYDFGRNVSGFIRLKLSVKNDADIYVIFDEMLSDGVVDPVRNFCCNVIKWSLKTGDYVCEAFEINTLKYLQIISDGGEFSVGKAEVVLVENPSAYSLGIQTDDKTVNAILEAAANTLAQNSFDLLMDCPSRERAGWINDMYYSSRAYKLLSGKDDAVNASLLNYILCEKIPAVPEGMIPMCYPSDHIDGQYIPNNALWYVLDLTDNLSSSFFDNYRDKALRQIDDVFAYFEKFENEYSLLEDLEGWVFVEWSKANDPEFIKGVNFPSNMLYYKALKAAGEYLGRSDYLNKAKKIKEAILSLSFNGEFFEDNRIRVDKKLVRTGNISEACQYFAFFSGVADVKTHERLYCNLRDNFGVYRDLKAVYPDIDKANIITGLLMRLDLLNEQGEFDKVISETKEIFGGMAKKTSTLWEHTGAYASCNHCIAAYSAVILLRSLLGVVGVKDGDLGLTDNYSKSCDCSATFDFGSGKVCLEKKNGKRSLKET